MKRVAALAFCSTCLLGGCESTGVGNPSLTATAVNALSPEPDATDPTETLTSQLSHVELAVRELRWIACNSALAPVVAAGPYVVDLLTGQTNPPFASVTIPEGGFCGLDVPLSIDASDVTMQGKSLLMSGLRPDGALFILYAAMPGTIHIQPYPADTIWDSDNAMSVIWALRPARWLTQSEVDAEPAEPLGSRKSVIVIDANRHPLLYAAIRNRLGPRSSLNSDLNGNGQLDGDEEAAFIGVGLPELN